MAITSDYHIVLKKSSCLKKRTSALPDNPNSSFDGIPPKTSDKWLRNISVVHLGFLVTPGRLSMHRERLFGTIQYVIMRMRQLSCVLTKTELCALQWLLKCAHMRSYPEFYWMIDQISRVNQFWLILNIENFVHILYSLCRIGNDFSFDDSIAKAYGCIVRAFDPR